MKSKKSMLKLFVAAALFLATLVSYNTANSQTGGGECYTCLTSGCTNQLTEPGWNGCTMVEGVCHQFGGTCDCEQDPDGEVNPCAK